MFTNKKREGINRFVCDVSLYVAKTPKASIKYHKPSFPIIPFGIVAYSLVRQPFSKQLYFHMVLRRLYSLLLSSTPHACTCTSEPVTFLISVTQL